jgi:hypothetical protein
MKTFLILVLSSACFSLSIQAKVPVFSVDETGVHIAGIDGSNPIIYDNDWFTDVFDAYYIWARASLGIANLRGVIVSRDMWEHPNYRYPVERCIEDAEKAVRFVRESGLQNIPDVTLGADRVLEIPESGIIEDSEFHSTPGSRLIIAEAKKATKEKPLVVIAGGPLTTVANALLEDPSISQTMIVFSLSTSHYGYNGKDGWSANIVSKKANLVEWAAGQFWDENSVFRYEHFANLPDNPLTKEMKRFIQTDLGIANQLGDGAPLVWMFENSCWRNAEERGAVFIKPAIRYEVNGGRDVLNIPKTATDLDASRIEFFRVIHQLYGNRMQKEHRTARLFHSRRAGMLWVCPRQTGCWCRMIYGRTRHTHAGCMRSTYIR